MPTPIPDIEKQAFIALTQAAPPVYGGPLEASRLQDILNNYEDVYTAFMRQLPLFAANNAYLTEAAACFDKTQLEAVGIWVDPVTSSPPITDPVMIINATITDMPVYITPSSPPANQVLALLGTCTIDQIFVEGYTNLSELYIGPGAVVNLVNAASTQASIGIIYLPYLRSTPSRLNAAAYGSQIGQINVDPGSYFGGYTNDNPGANCDKAVTDFTASSITANSIVLSWVPPTEYLFLNVFYKKTESTVWLPVVDSEDPDFIPPGDYVGETGYVFRRLEKFTYYDFKVAVTCKNGGIGNAYLYQQTVCCDCGSPPEA